MTWIDYTIQLWGDDWAVARKTPKNLARYRRCLTNKEYQMAYAAWLDGRWAAFPVGFGDT